MILKHLELAVLQEEEERLRREGERAFKRQQKTAESALPSGLDNPPEETSSPLPQQPAAADTQSAVGKDGCRLQESQQNQQHQQQQQQNQQQQQQQQPQAKSQAAAAPAPKLTKAQRQRYLFLLQLGCARLWFLSGSEQL